MVSDVTPLASAFLAGAMSLWVDVTVGLIVEVAVWTVGLFSAASITLPIIALPIIALSFASAAGAMSLNGANARVFGSIFMTARAVGSFAQPVPAPANVFRVGDWLQVCGIHTMPRLADGMVKFETIWHGTNEVFINKPVCHVALSPPATTAVTLLGNRAIPQPTLFGLSIWDTFRQQFLNRLDADTIRWHSGNLNFSGCRAGDVCSVPRPLNLT
jgi:hypothetical protein